MIHFKTDKDRMCSLKLVMNVDTANSMASDWEGITFSMLMSHDFYIFK